MEPTAQVETPAVAKTQPTQPTFLEKIIPYWLSLPLNMILFFMFALSLFFAYARAREVITEREKVKILKQENENLRGMLKNIE